MDSTLKHTQHDSKTSAIRIVVILLKTENIMISKSKITLAVCVAISMVICVVVSCTKNENFQREGTSSLRESKSDSGSDIVYTLSFVQNDTRYSIIGTMGDSNYVLKSVPDNSTSISATNQSTTNDFVYIDSTDISFYPINSNTVAVHYSDFPSGALNFEMRQIRSQEDTVWFDMYVNSSIVNSYKLYGNKGFASLFLGEIFSGSSAKVAPLVYYSGAAVRLAGVMTVLSMDHNIVPILSSEEVRAYWCIRDMEVYANECRSTCGIPRVVHHVHHEGCEFHCQTNSAY